MSSGQCGTRLDWHWVPPWLSQGCHQSAAYSGVCCFMLMWMDSGASHSSRLRGRLLRSQVSTFWIKEHRMIDESRSNCPRIFAWAARVSEVFSPPETSSSSRSACCRLRPAVTDGLFKRLSGFCTRSLSVLQECLRHGCARLASQQTSRSALLQAAWFAFHSVCLMLNISATSSNHISRSVVSSRFHVLLAEKKSASSPTRSSPSCTSFFFKQNEDEHGVATDHVQTNKRRRAACATKTRGALPDGRQAHVGPASTSHVPMSARRSIGEPPER